MVFLFWIVLSAGVGYISEQLDRSWIVWTALSLLFSPAIALVGLIAVDMTGAEPLTVGGSEPDSEIAEEAQVVEAGDGQKPRKSHPNGRVFSDTTRKTFAYLGIGLGAIIVAIILGTLIAYAVGDL